MSKTYNHIVIVGRVGGDPEWFQAGKGLAKFAVATDRWGKDKSPDWHKVNCWGKTGEIAMKYIQKGTLVLIAGELNYSRRENDDGSTSYFTDINCHRMQILDGGKYGGEEEKPEPDMPF